MALRGKPFTGDEQIADADFANTVSGFAYDGFTKVVVYNGTDNTGDLIAASTSGLTSEVVHLPAAVAAPAGIFVDTTGAGKGSVYV